MACRDKRPKWALLYAMLPIIGGFLWLDSRLRLSAGGHTILELGILLAVFGLVEAWLTANRGALMRMPVDQPWPGAYLPQAPGEQLIQPSHTSTGSEGNPVVKARFALHEGEVQRVN